MLCQRVPDFPARRPRYNKKTDRSNPVGLIKDGSLYFLVARSLSASAARFE